MRHRAILAIATAFAVVVLIVPLAASACEGTNPLTLSGNWSTTASLLSFGADPAPSQGMSMPASAPRTLHRARMALGTMPPLIELGDLTLGGSQYSVAWRISTSTSGGRLISFPLDVGTTWSGTYISNTKWKRRQGWESTIPRSRLSLASMVAV